MITRPTRSIIDIFSSFALFIPTSIENVIREMANLKGRSCSQETWKPLDVTDLRAYIGLLILGGVCSSHASEKIPSDIENDKIRRSQFQGVTSLKRQHVAQNQATHGTGIFTLAGRQVEHREKNQCMRMVLDMTKGLKGHNDTCDNFFTSYALGLELRKKKLTLLGCLKPSQSNCGNWFSSRPSSELFQNRLF
ncbi:Undecaprenyl-diphosphatase [Trichinella spiralis]|uniref:Undecaprenyl-diphosphatase n=1 Tax=Trichinella spiralis TaxID=6334 RepID=A0ABR3K530_TRISP